MCGFGTSRWGRAGGCTAHRYVLCCACGLPTRGARRGFTSSLPLPRHQSSRHLFSVCSRITPSPERAASCTTCLDRCDMRDRRAADTRGGDSGTGDARRPTSVERGASRGRRTNSHVSVSHPTRLPTNSLRLSPAGRRPSITSSRVARPPPRPAPAPRPGARHFLCDRCT